MSTVVEATFDVQLAGLGASHEARESTGHAVRLDGLPIEPRWSTIVIPMSEGLVRQLAQHLFETVKVTIRIECPTAEAET